LKKCSHRADFGTFDFETPSALQHSCDKVQQVATFARKLPETAVIAGHLAQLKYRRTLELRRFDIVQMIQRSVDGVRIALESHEQCHKKLG
jgi:hypothetical protein